MIDDIKYFAYYIAFLDGDYKQLNNSLWQIGRDELIRGGLVAGLGVLGLKKKDN